MEQTHKQKDIEIRTYKKTDSVKFKLDTVLLIIIFAIVICNDYLG